MAVVKRIAPGSAFKVGLIVYGVMGLIIGLCVSLFALIGASIVSEAQGGVGGMFFGALAVVFFPIFYGIIGGISGALGAVIYNLAAKWVGGLEIDLS